MSAQIQAFGFRAESAPAPSSVSDLRHVAPRDLRMRRRSEFRIAVVPAVTEYLVGRNGLQHLVQSSARRTGRDDVRPAEVDVNIRENLRDRGCLALVRIAHVEQIELYLRVQKNKLVK